MASRRKRGDGPDSVNAVLFFLLGGPAMIWFNRTFILDRLPLFVALGLCLLVLLVLVVRRLLRQRRADAARQRELDAHVASTDGMSGLEFERLVARLMERDGLTDVRVSGGSGDLGADVLGRHADGRTVVVQCKRYAQHRSVGSPDMQKFLGTCFHEHGADEAWFVTTTRFSKAAHDLGTRRGVRLVDRQRLAQWMTAMADQPA